MARPREFDEQEVLEAASDAFWAQGYEGTSTRDLVKATGLTQPSLYNAFGDKRGLYRRALEHYLEHTLRERIVRLETSLPPGRAVSAFFGEIVERSVGDPQKRGCMLVNSALEATPEDEDLREAVIEELAEVRDFFHRCLSAGQRGGEIPGVVPAQDAARHLVAVMIGMRVLARVNPERAWLAGAISPALSLLGLPPLPSIQPRR
jgi:TetR/AcrR family transcriptional regulator, transcriptional repressor for nem operon